VLAAHRYGIKRVILPERNLKDLVEVPADVLSSLEILVAKRMEDVLEHAFDGGCDSNLTCCLWEHVNEVSCSGPAKRI
ncbi:hypothetical protein Gohar_012123, partial [Gossypium harknessii]|nr:hypothetical protein [Gossypium harknessii]